MERILCEEAQQLREKSLPNLLSLKRFVVNGGCLWLIWFSLNSSRNVDGVKQEVYELTVFSKEELTNQEREFDLDSFVSPDWVVFNDVIYQLLVNLRLTNDTIMKRLRFTI